VARFELRAAGRQRPAGFSFCLFYNIFYNINKKCAYFLAGRSGVFRLFVGAPPILSWYAAEQNRCLGSLWLAAPLPA